MTDGKAKFTCQIIRQILANPEGRTFGKENRYLIWRMMNSLGKRQTPNELSAGGTFEENGVGFNKFDAMLLSRMIWETRQFKGLTIRQAWLVARRLKKYVRQLCAIAKTPYTETFVPKEQKAKEQKPVQQQMFKQPRHPCDF